MVLGRAFTSWLILLFIKTWMGVESLHFGKYSNQSKCGLEFGLDLGEQLRVKGVRFWLVVEVASRASK